GLFGDQAGECAAIRGFQVVVEEFFADDGAGINDVDEEIIAVLAIAMREVGADLAAFIIKAMAEAAGFFEEFAATDGIAAEGAEVVVETANVGQFFLRSSARD